MEVYHFLKMRPENLAFFGPIVNTEYIIAHHDETKVDECMTGALMISVGESSM